MKDMWDQRYSKTEFAYGEQPNSYFKEQLSKLPAGKILLPADGEGRNGVYAATLGWNVYSFDQSAAGKEKAVQLADKQGVTITYDVGEFQSLTYQPNQFDAIALIYAHFPADKKSAYHKILTSYLKPRGVVIFEAFSKKHLDYSREDEKVGGPKDIDQLFSVEELQSDFADFEIIELGEHVLELHEGLFHNGMSSVIRFVGRKK